MKLRVFLYHRVTDQSDELWPAVHPKRFDLHLNYLSSKYHLIQLEKYLHAPDTFKGSPKPLGAVVFDDGYRDFLDHALPVLKKYRVPSSIYVVTQCVETQRLIWTYELDYLFSHTSKPGIDLGITALRADSKWRNRQERLNFARELKRYLKTLAHGDRATHCAAIMAQLGDVELPSGMYLDWDELARIKNAGVEIGSHTVTHSLLATVQDEGEMKSEMDKSRQDIKDNLGFWTDVIAYPGGNYDERVMAVARSCGYRFGLAVDQRAYRVGVDDNMAIPRIELYNEPLWKTRLRERELIQRLKKFLGRS